MIKLNSITLKDLKQLSPEIYLILATVYYWTLTAHLYNPVAIGLLLVLLYQVLFRKMTSGILISTVFILLNLFLILAMLSELSEFTETNGNFYQLAVVGTLFIGCNLLAGLFMLWKYLNQSVT